MIRYKDLIWPCATAKLPALCHDQAAAEEKTKHHKNSPTGLYVKVPTFCKAMCYTRGSLDDRHVRSKYQVLMIPFPNNNVFPCISWGDAMQEIETAIELANPYARETRIMLCRAADEYWSVMNSSETADEGE